MMKKTLLWSLIVLLHPLVSAAEDNAVYESLRGVRIGRVFFTQIERDLLDARRLIEPSGGAVEEVNRDAPVRTRPRASAGYIIGRQGRSQVWKDGDFVEISRDPEISVSFPGDVKITRHAARDKPTNSKERVLTRSEQLAEDDDG
ncbi:MAG: hypothetical protein OEQ14_07525 [Gammaproteobacteria bacterium]|nr:hypothetical protein [Gammaproteobacteria bacterium]